MRLTKEGIAHLRHSLVCYLSKSLRRFGASSNPIDRGCGEGVGRARGEREESNIGIDDQYKLQ